MEKATILKIREVFEAAEIKEYTVEFNNNLNIHFGIEGVYSWWDDDNEILWCLKNKVSRSSDYRANGEIQAYSYTEIQFIRAGVNYKEIKSVLNSTNCKINQEVTEIVNEICANHLHLYPETSYPGKDGDGKPILYNGRPTIRSGV